MAIEIEAKYEADADAALPDLGALPKVHGIRGPADERLEAEYYDTADLRLLRSGITLRRRKGGHDAGWHLKLPAGPGSREEIQLPLGQSGRRVPAQLANLVKARSRGAQLALVAVITTQRQTITLLGSDGEPVAEVADDQVHGVATASGSAPPSRWREVEIELSRAERDRDVLEAADTLLGRAGMRRSGRTAKLERVLSDQLSPPAVPPTAVPPTAVPPTAAPPPAAPPPAHLTAAAVITAYLREHAERLLALDPAVRRREPDAVHKMRVATRRLRSTLRAFGSVASAADSQRVADELKWLGAVLGDERDAEVQALRLQAHVAATEIEVLLGPVQARIQAHAAKAAGTSHSAVMTALGSERYITMLDALDALIASPKEGPEADRSADDIVPTAVWRSYRQTRRRMRAAILEPPGPGRDAAMHAARKSAKRTRYAAEAAIPIGGKQAEQLAGQMKNVQSVLGDHHDTVVGRQISRRLGIAAHLAGESAFTYGLFYERDACSAERLETSARKTWQRACRRKYRTWLV